VDIFNIFGKNNISSYTSHFNYLLLKIDTMSKTKKQLLKTSDVINLTSAKRDPAFVDRLSPARKTLFRCIQCGTCSASCPSASAMDISPRQMWRLANLGFEDEILNSKTMWLCSLCYSCHVRCPRGIPLTDTIVKIKQLALRKKFRERSESVAFYKAFSDVMRIYGRMREMEFMLRFFLASNILKSLAFIKLGITLLSRGKVFPEMPNLGKGRLDRLFKRVEELERQK
jgi:heterodisulfide reductase subunit C